MNVKQTVFKKILSLPYERIAVLFDQIKCLKFYYEILLINIFMAPFIVPYAHCKCSGWIPCWNPSPAQFWLNSCVHCFSWTWSMLYRAYNKMRILGWISILKQSHCYCTLYETLHTFQYYFMCFNFLDPAEPTEIMHKNISS